MNVNIVIQGKGVPLVLFHGWGFDSQIWHSILPELEVNHQLYLVDLPGFGLTPPMEWDVFKTDLLKQLPVNFALVGWSMGGMFATRLAIEDPERVNHLVNVASSPRFIREARWPGIDPQMFKTFYQNLASNPRHILQQFIELQLQGQRLPPTMFGHIPTVNGLREGLDVLVNWDLRQQLALLDKPVLYMFGRLDAIMPRMTMTTMQGLYPNFNYIIFPKAAHAPFLSHSDEFIATLTEFIK